MEQLTIIAGATPAQQEAAAMHFEIVEAAKGAVNSLLDLGRKLKRMRDSGRFKDLGFETFGAYTEAAVGIKQRQAYNYIQVVETLPARLIEENAASGITKLSLLCKFGPADREEILREGLANITVAELQKLVEERDGLVEQLSMLKSGPAAPVAEVQAEEVDLDAIRAEAAAQAREEEQRRHEEALAQAKREQEEAVAAARREAEAEAKKKIREATEKAQEQARKTAVQQIAEEREKAASQARAQQEAADRAALEEARRREAEAMQRAEETAKQLQLAADKDSARFALLFDDLQAKATAMVELAEAMRAQGKVEQAEKFMGALKRALEALRESLEGEGE